LENIINRYGVEILGEDDIKQFKLMKGFTGRVSDILAMVADRLQPRSFDELEKHWLDDLEI
jgi:hypothetical protein